MGLRRFSFQRVDVIVWDAIVDSSDSTSYPAGHNHDPSDETIVVKTLMQIYLMTMNDAEQVSMLEHVMVVIDSSTEGSDNFLFTPPATCRPHLASACRQRRLNSASLLLRTAPARQKSLWMIALRGANVEGHAWQGFFSVSSVLVGLVGSKKSNTLDICPLVCSLEEGKGELIGFWAISTRLPFFVCSCARETK